MSSLRSDVEICGQFSCIWKQFWGNGGGLFGEVLLFFLHQSETARLSARKTEEARQKQINTVLMRRERELPDETAGRSEDGEEDGRNGSRTNSSCLSVGNWMEGNLAISCSEGILGAQYPLGSHGVSGTPRAPTNRTMDYWVNGKSIQQF